MKRLPGTRGPGTAEDEEAAWPRGPGTAEDEEAAWPRGPGTADDEEAAWPRGPGTADDEEAAWPRGPGTAEDTITEAVGPLEREMVERVRPVPSWNSLPADGSTDSL